MEKELFDWEGWDIIDTSTFYFYNITLKRDIGSFKTGEQLAGAMVCYEEGELVLQNGDKEEMFKLHLKVA